MASDLRQVVQVHLAREQQVGWTVVGRRALAGIVVGVVLVSDGQGIARVVMGIYLVPRPQHQHATGGESDIAAVEPGTSDSVQNAPQIVVGKDKMPGPVRFAVDVPTAGPCPRSPWTTERSAEALPPLRSPARGVVLNGSHDPSGLLAVRIDISRGRHLPEPA